MTGYPDPSARSNAVVGRKRTEWAVHSLRAQSAISCRTRSSKSYFLAIESYSASAKAIARVTRQTASPLGTRYVPGRDPNGSHALLCARQGPFRRFPNTSSVHRSTREEPPAKGFLQTSSVAEMRAVRPVKAYWTEPSAPGHRVKLRRFDGVTPAQRPPSSRTQCRAVQGPGQHHGFQFRKSSQRCSDLSLMSNEGASCRSLASSSRPVIFGARHVRTCRPDRSTRRRGAGSSLALVDRGVCKDFGSLGALSEGGRGHGSFLVSHSSHGEWSVLCDTSEAGHVSRKNRPIRLPPMRKHGLTSGALRFTAG
jgi:hypothetical protein